MCVLLCVCLTNYWYIKQGRLMHTLESFNLTNECNLWMCTSVHVINMFVFHCCYCFLFHFVIIGSFLSIVWSFCNFKVYGRNVLFCHVAIFYLAEVATNRFRNNKLRRLVSSLYTLKRRDIVECIYNVDQHIIYTVYIYKYDIVVKAKHGESKTRL